MDISVSYNSLSITKKRKVTEEVNCAEINKENIVNNKNKVKKVKKVSKKKPVSCDWIQYIEEDNSPVTKSPRRDAENFLKETVNERLWDNWTIVYDHQQKLKAKRFARVALKQAKWLALRARLAKAAEKRSQFLRDEEEKEKKSCNSMDSDPSISNNRESTANILDNQISTSSVDLEDALEVMKMVSNQPSTSSPKAVEMNAEDVIGIGGIVIDLLAETVSLEKKTQRQEDNQETSEGLTQQLDLDTLFPQ